MTSCLISNENYLNENINKLCDSGLLTWDDISNILENVKEDQYIRKLMKQKFITYEHYLKNTQIDDYYWDTDYISSNTPFEIMLQNQHRSWNYDKAIDFKWEYVLKYPKLKWNFHSLSLHKNICWEVVMKFSNEAWEYDFMSYKNLTIDVVKTLPNKPWNWDCLSRLQCISYEDVQNNSNLPWNFEIVERKLLIDKSLTVIIGKHCTKIFMFPLIILMIIQN